MEGGLTTAIFTLIEKLEQDVAITSFMYLLIEYVEELIVIVLLFMVIILKLGEDLGFKFMMVERLGSESLLVLTIHCLLYPILLVCCGV